MPELPEVEMIARLLNDELRGNEVASVRMAGVGTLRSYDPPLTQIEGASFVGFRRIGKHLLTDFDNQLTLLIHLMSAGRLQLFDKQASLRDRTSRILIRLKDARELRLREFGTRQSAWAKLIKTADVLTDDSIATLGPEAWPEVPELSAVSAESRPLHSLLRDQRVIAGIGRSWVDEILHDSQLPPFRRGDSLSEEELSKLKKSIHDVLDTAIKHYEKVLELPIPDKLPMPLKVHRHHGEPCPRCGTKLEAVFYEDHVMVYCPTCQTGGKLLKDRRLSRLLK